MRWRVVELGKRFGVCDLYVISDDYIPPSWEYLGKFDTLDKAMDKIEEISGQEAKIISVEDADTVAMTQ